VEALKWPKMMLVTDAMPALNFDIKAVPNGAASFTRLMARHVRDNGVMDLMEGLRRTAYYPAERLAEFAPRFRNKGRIKVGADADLLVFKLENLRDNATYMDPYRETSGYDWIIVGGEVVIAGGDPVGATPGQPVFNLP